MKKILSVMLAIMMLLSGMVFTTSAADSELDTYMNTMLNKDNVIIVFNFGAGKNKRALPVYDASTGGFTMADAEKVTGTYYLLPGAGGNSLTQGKVVVLPSVVAPESKDFIGWDCNLTEYDLVAGHRFILTEDIIARAQEESNGIIYMDALYESSVEEEDTMTMILGVLMKVFGTIAGILFLDGNSSAGVELMQGVLGGLLG